MDNDQQRLKQLLNDVQSDADNTELRAEIFDHALNLGDLALAGEQVARMLPQRPDDVQWLARQALLVRCEGRYAEAEQLLAAIFAAGYEDPSLSYEMGYCLAHQRKYEEALLWLEPLLEGDEPFAPAILPWLRCRQALEQFPGLLDTFVALTERCEPTAAAWGTASIFAIDAERLDDARAWAQQALARNPRQQDALVAMAILAVVTQGAESGRRQLEECVESFPRNGRAWSALGMAQMQQLELPAAVQSLTRAVELMPEHVGTWLALGWSQLGAKDYAGAQRSFEGALEQDRNFGESHGALAIALLAQCKPAKDSVERALRLDRQCQSGILAQALMSGKVTNPEQLRRLAGRILGRSHTLTGASVLEQALAHIPGGDTA